MDEYISASLTREQLLEAVKKIELLLVNPEEEELARKVNELEERLAAERQTRQQLKSHVETIVETTNQVAEEVNELQSAGNNWRNMWLHLNEENEEAKAQIAAEQQYYEAQGKELQTLLNATKYELELFSGGVEALKSLTLPASIALEKKLLDALAKVHTKKSQLLLYEAQSHVDAHRQCIVCHARTISVMTEPCNHVCLCLHCLSNVDKCPLCRSLILKYEKVYFG